MTLPNPEFWRGRRVLVTGHTGFMGGWLSLWLARMGAWATGLALPPEDGRGIYTAANVGAHITPVFGNIRDASLVRECVRLMRPQIVFHFAAQSSSGRAHADPVTTYETNVLGAAKVLEELRRFPFVRAVIVVTSDRVYANGGDARAHTEDDPLGRDDEPLAASKAAAELAVSAFRRSLVADHPLGIATVRTAHAIGGGDWAEDRLIPDAMRAFTQGEPFVVRTPAAIRSWQYVLDALCGTLLLAEHLAVDDALVWRSAWNFGPQETGRLVSETADQLVRLWNSAAIYGPDVTWRAASDEILPYEAPVVLDSTKARQSLGWYPRFDLDAGLAAAVDWHHAQARGEDMAAMSSRALDDYLY